MGETPWEVGSERNERNESPSDGALKEYLETQRRTETQKSSEKGMLWINMCNQVSLEHLFK